jgi:hypothetical protein
MLYIRVEQLPHDNRGRKLMEKTTMPPRRDGRRAVRALALAMLCGVLAQGAQAQNVFLCVSASGGKELTDTYRPGCKTLEVPG